MLMFSVCTRVHPRIVACVSTVGTLADVWSVAVLHLSSLSLEAMILLPDGLQSGVVQSSFVMRH